MKRSAELLHLGKGSKPSKKSYKYLYAITLIASLLWFTTYHGKVVNPYRFTTHSRNVDECDKLKNIRDTYFCYIERAKIQADDLVNRQSKSPEEAIFAYQARYHRQPPRGFYQWAQYAMESDSTIIDDFDSIDKDLAPFRNMDSTILRAAIDAAKISWPDNQIGEVRFQNGMLNSTGNTRGALSIHTLASILDPVLDRLSDFRIFYNWYAEPRMLGNEIHDTSNKGVTIFDYSRSSTWDLLMEACPYNSLADSIVVRYSSNDRDICKREKGPPVKGLHGFFNGPDQFRPIQTLFPIMSRAKVSSMRDILVPNVCYANSGWRGFLAADNISFVDKAPALYWRGSSTGQWMTAKTWHTSHRLRFGRYIRWLTERAGKTTFPGASKLSPDYLGALQRLNASNFNASINHWNNCDKDICKPLADYFGSPPRIKAEVANDYKFVFDSDGQSMSCRFYRLMQSNSIVLKSTGWSEWHDERLIPWLHYIPISLELDEIPMVLDYFINDPRGQKHALEISKVSREWVDRSLRVVDITIFYYRLLLEYGSIQKL